MAATNINAPFGFQPIGPNKSSNAYSIASGYNTEIGLYSPVRASGTGNGHLPGIVLGTTGNPIVGVFGGCTYNLPNGTQVRSLYWPANTTATNIIATVYDDPTQLYQAQMSGAFAITNYYSKANFLSGSDINGQSTYAVNSTGIGSGTDFLVQRALNMDSNLIGNYTIVEGLFLQNANSYPFTL